MIAGMTLACALLVPGVSFAAPAPGAEVPAQTVSYYNLGTEARGRGDHRAAKEAFLKLLEQSPRSGGALEGLSLACLSLGEYDEARGYLERWNAQSPRNPYILGMLARAYSSLRLADERLSVLSQIVEADPCDVRSFRRLDGLRAERRPGLLPEARGYKSLVFEGLETSSPQRIVYEGHSGGLRARGRIASQLDLLGGAEFRQEAQRNDTRGFTYYDILEQRYTLGLEARPDKDSRLEADYGQSLYSDNQSAGIGRTSFSRVRLAGDLHALSSDFRAALAREPKFLRGAGGNQYFAILRESSARLEAETSRWGWGLRGRAAIYDYSERTTWRSWSLLGTKEFGNNLIQPSYSHNQQEFYGAAPDGRLRAVDYDGAGLRARRLVADVYQLSGSYGRYLYRDANRLDESYAEATGWLPWHKDPCGSPDFSAGYRYSHTDYLVSADGYRSTDQENHWLGAYWRRGHKLGLWTMLGYEHGFLHDTRGSYEGNAWLAELEWYHKDKTSLKAQGRVASDTAREESYSFGLQARYSF